MKKPCVQSLIKKAQALQEVGLYQRAGRVWLEVFDTSEITSEREHCLKQRKKCLQHSPCTRYTERMWDMAGRFNGDV
ncbi:PerC family transcriptional regulator [Phytobacter sp. V91]|uniref:PerC family transcriptional regulator n=1 Tax=Phytobacter sp. V91 TaxID=3369425 RepID=UPI003F62FAA8